MSEPVNPSLPASYAHCSAVARRQARNFYPSFLLLPPDRRRSMCTLYAFLRQTDDIADEPGPAGAKRLALADWRASLHRALAGDFGPWPGWPALAETVARHGIPARHLDLVIDGVEMDTEPRVFETFDELHAYCYRVASAVGLCCLHIWGFRSDGGRAEGLAEACGLALQLTNILRDVREDAGNGRVYLPRDDMARFGVPAEALASTTTGPALRRLLAFEGARAYDYFERAGPLAGLVDPVGRPALRAIVGVYRALLDEIARRDYDVLPRRVAVPRWRKVAIVAGAYVGGFARPDAPARVEAPPPR